MKLGFATDIHLDHVKSDKFFSKQKRVGEALTKDVDALVIGGDISIGHFLEEHLKAFMSGAACPVYFVLGNHDFWRNHEDNVWKAAQAHEGSLDFSGAVELTPSTGLVGLSGWYDTRAGNVFQPGIIMPEFTMTTRLLRLGPLITPNGPRKQSIFWPPELLHEAHNVCKAWADEQTQKFLPKLEDAAKKYSTVFIVTHIPPWVEACWSPSGGLSRDVSPEWLPWSVNVNLGLQIEALAEEYPEVQFQVLSGHTHGKGESVISENVKSYSGAATYKMPKMARVFDLG